MKRASAGRHIILNLYNKPKSPYNSEQKNFSFKEYEKMITKDMLIGDIVEKYSEAAPVMMMAGLGCIGCAIAASETLEEGCAAHGVDADDLVAALNDAVKAAKD